MKRIIHYTSGLADTRAGVEVFIMTLFENVDEDAISFSILTRNSKKNSPLYKEFVDRGIEICDLECSNLGIKNVLAFRKKLEVFFSTHKGEFDFIHMHGCDDPFVIQIAKKYGVKKAAVHIHSIQRENKNLLKNFFKKFTSIHNIRYADYRFACSIAAGESVFQNKKFEVIPNCIDTKRYQFDVLTRNRVRKNLHLNEEEIAVCYVGRFSHIKNLDFLLDVFVHLREISSQYKLIMIGDGEEKKTLLDAIENKDIKESVLLIGQRNDVFCLLNGMDIYLQTSIKEGFSLSALEAQCNGLPTFISDGFPDEIMITDIIHKYGLDISSTVWAREIDCIFHSSEINRQKYAEYVSDAGYDLVEMWNSVKDMYGQ